VKKNLFNIDLDKSSDVYGSQSQKACDPCAAECKKINRKINNRKLSDIKGKEIEEIISAFKTKFSF
jgi:hypothetical protein